MKRIFRLLVVAALCVGLAQGMNAEQDDIADVLAPGGRKRAIKKSQNKTIDVYKTSHLEELWTIKSSKQEDGSDPIGVTKIKKNTKGLNTKKLKFPTNIQWYLFVERPNKTQVRTPLGMSEGKNNIRIDSILVLDSDGKAKVKLKGEEPNYRVSREKKAEMT